MISEILKEKTLKPRFFLHDEMKAWLRDNLHLSIICESPSSTYIPSIANMDQDYYNRYQENVPIPDYIRLTGTLRCDGEELGMTYGHTIDLREYGKILKASSKRLEENEKNIKQLLQNQMVLQQELVILKQELAELKQK